MDARARIGLGCMRLSTNPDRDDDATLVKVLHAALDAGVNLLDTADAYALDATETGHNERLIARALETWDGDRSAVVVSTKGGIRRPGGRWVPDGRAKHLAAACAESRAALGVDRIDLYLLHTIDPKTKLETSVRALKRLKDKGEIARIGLCNVTLGQLRRAQKIVPIDAVQVKLGADDDDPLRNGVAEHCRDHGIMLMAHSPFGGRGRPARFGKDEVLTGLAERHGATQAEIVLAWLRDLADFIVPLPGASRVDTAESSARGQRIALDDADRAALDERFPAERVLRVPRAERRPAPDADGDVVVVMGIPAAGKTTLAQAFVDHGYARLNRDTAGGTLSALAKTLDETLDAGTRHVVLDNTYGSRAARNEVIETAWRHGVPARCVWLQTSAADAQVNAVTRMLDVCGELLDAETIRADKIRDPRVLVPRVIFEYARHLEPPAEEEGFESIEPVTFARERDESYRTRAIIFELNALLTTSNPLAADEVAILPGRIERLHELQSEGWVLLGISAQPAVADGDLTEDEVEAFFDDVCDALDVDLDIVHCPHGGGPPACWCRKPLPGLGVVFIERYQLDPAQCTMVGTGSNDATFAERCGFGFVEADAFFG